MPSYNKSTNPTANGNSNGNFNGNSSRNSKPNQGRRRYQKPVAKVRTTSPNADSAATVAASAWGNFHTTIKSDDRDISAKSAENTARMAAGRNDSAILQAHVYHTGIKQEVVHTPPATPIVAKFEDAIPAGPAIPESDLAAAANDIDHPAQIQAELPAVEPVITMQIVANEDTTITSTDITVDKSEIVTAAVQVCPQPDIAVAAKEIEQPSQIHDVGPVVEPTTTVQSYVDREVQIDENNLEAFKVKKDKIHGFFTIVSMLPMVYIDLAVLVFSRAWEYVCGWVAGN